MRQTSVIAIGLPNSGKSTFLGALGYLLQHDEVKTVLKLTRLPEDATYIDSLTNDWLSCTEVERTKAGLKNIKLELQKSAELLGDVTFPDISGETFEQHWALREWEADFAALAQNATGILLFVHPLHLDKPYSVADSARMAVAAGEVVTENKAELWDPARAAPQVKLVDFLQMVSSRTERKPPLRLSVIVSAWDLVRRANDKAVPDKWIKKTAPLLFQYVIANPELFDTQFYGISAQGGDNIQDGDTLRAYDEPSTRVVVVGPNCDEHDLTKPLEWSLGSNV